MKRIGILIVLFTVLFGAQTFTQEYQNYISCNVDGEEFYAEAKRLRLGMRNWDYLGVAAFKVSPDVQVWIRIMYLKDQLEPGTYQLVSEEYLNSKKRRDRDVEPVYVLIDYVEETAKFGHGYHNGESLSGTLTIESVTPTSVSGSFEATLTGVHYKKRGLATVTGTGVRGNLQRKMVTQAGGGMLAHGHPHDLPNTRRQKETDTIILGQGRFYMDWSKE
jgi:hypothetical protein